MVSTVISIAKDVFRKITSRGKRESVSLDSLSHSIGYHFKDKSLLRQSLTHRSSLSNPKERWMSNERLEFLGDAVLELVVCTELYRRFPEGNEGQLTKAKSRIVSRDMLSRKARQIKLGRYIILGKGEIRSGGRHRRSILADTYEALLGAIYLDGGLEQVERFIQKHVLKNIGDLFTSKFHQNYKSWLLEYVQSKGDSGPKYRVDKETGPDHRKEFTIHAIVNDKVCGEGKGYSKKMAQQNAARNALQKLGLIQEETQD